MLDVVRERRSDTRGGASSSEKEISVLCFGVDMALGAHDFFIKSDTN